MLTYTGVQNLPGERRISPNQMGKNEDIRRVRFQIRPPNYLIRQSPFQKSETLNVAITFRNGN